MVPDSLYEVLQCGRCRLLHPFHCRTCPRCGATDPSVVRASRDVVSRTALSLLVPEHEIVVPRASASRYTTRSLAHKVPRPPWWTPDSAKRLLTRLSCYLRPRPNWWA